MIHKNNSFSYFVPIGSNEKFDIEAIEKGSKAIIRIGSFFIANGEMSIDSFKKIEIGNSRDDYSLYYRSRLINENQNYTTRRTGDNKIYLEEFKNNAKRDLPSSQINMKKIIALKNTFASPVTQNFNQGRNIIITDKTNFIYEQYLSSYVESRKNFTETIFVDSKANTHFKFQGNDNVFILRCCNSKLQIV